MDPKMNTVSIPPKPPPMTSQPEIKYIRLERPQNIMGITAAEKRSAIRKMFRTLGALRATTMTGALMHSTIRRTQTMGILFRKKSLEIVEAIAD
jgi:hypothetical protein